MVVDTSFVLSLLKQHKSFDEEIRNVVKQPSRIVAPDSVIMELQRLSRDGNFNTAGQAKIALEILERRGIETIETKPEVPEADAAILALALALKEPAALATVDRQLREISLKLGLTTIFLTGRKGLVVSRGLNQKHLK